MIGPSSHRAAASALIWLREENCEAPQFGNIDICAADVIANAATSVVRCARWSKTMITS